MEREHIVKYVAGLGDGTYIIEHPDGQLERRRNETDVARLDAMSDADIEAAAASDPDWVAFQEIDWSKAVIQPAPRKKPISIRLDEDVLEFFKQQGAGYQRRVNAVLRAYMGEAVKAGGPRSAKPEKRPRSSAQGRG
jgi:uncharacterized protein (DUF4415 family)